MSQMVNNVMFACLPWLVVLAIALLAARVLIAISHARLNLQRVRQLNACQEGSVQSLGFVLTIPFFLMIVMLIIQVSQVMLGNVLVHYAAFTSARSAVVWIPTNTNLNETENRISSLDQIESTSEGTRYLVAPNMFSDKYQKIQQAAVLACLPMAPSRDLGYQLDGAADLTSVALIRLYAGLDADSQANTLIPRRIRNKLAYASGNTDVRLTFWHRFGPFDDLQDPPLQTRYFIGPDRLEFFNNEVGWQDEFTSTVTHRLALLPGPLRFFVGNVEPDQTGQAFTFPITASATLVNEGEKPLLSYWQEEFQ